jgi:hypothetical protein
VRLGVVKQGSKHILVRLIVAGTHHEIHCIVATLLLSDAFHHVAFVHEHRADFQIHFSDEDVDAWETKKSLVTFMRFPDTKDKEDKGG